MRTQIVVCDGCKKDLTESSNCVDYRLALVNEPIPSGDGPVTAMNIEPHIQGARHFCNVACLKRWAINNL